jgi:hypothetical protein
LELSYAIWSRTKNLQIWSETKTLQFIKKLLCMFVHVVLLFDFFFLLRKESNYNFGNGIEVGHIMF